MNELRAKFTLDNTEPIKVKFSLNLTPSKLSQLENDMGFVRKEEINLPDVDFDDLATKQEVENISTQKVDISDFENAIDDINSTLETKQPKGDYASPNDIPDISNLATKDELKTEIDKVNETLGDIDSLLDAINGEVI